MSNIYYHHPDDKQFSLDFLHDDLQKIENRIDSYDDTIEAKCIEYDLDREFTAVYTTSGGGGVVKALDFDFEKEIESINDNNGDIVVRLLDMYRKLIATNEQESGVPVEAYKNIDIGGLATMLDETDWSGTATDVAGRLASNLILQHALPNANHRTAIALIQFYHRRIDSNFSMPETKVEIDPDTYDWQKWVSTYINESKRLLTVRRKNLLLMYAGEFGVTSVERKHGVRIELADYELDMHSHEAKKSLC
jgi:prophage maintenance system killer protein